MFPEKQASPKFNQAFLGSKPFSWATGRLASIVFSFCLCLRDLIILWIFVSAFHMNSMLLRDCETHYS
uniref:Uncharacterized protein n=1 Tax=Manihot esculenta TaxID=3983 RepID=A0A2C9VC13_MANES